MKTKHKAVDKEKSRQKSSVFICADVRHTKISFVCSDITKSSMWVNIPKN